MKDQLTCIALGKTSSGFPKFEWAGLLKKQKKKKTHHNKMINKKISQY